MTLSFNDFKLPSELLKDIATQGYETPTPIQQKAIPIILEGRDLLGAAQTGTGKTAAYIIPLVKQIKEKTQPYEKKVPKVLVLTPTRELAAQVGETISALGKTMKIRFAVVFGGVGINPQKAAIAKGLDFLVATPGRLLDLVNQKFVDLSKTSVLVLDEADRMLDMGFLPDLKRILNKLPKARQTLLFSATFSPEIKKLSEHFLHNAKAVEIERNKSADLIRQTLYKVPKAAKHDALRDLIVDNNWQQVLVFTRTKHGADKLVRQLVKDGFKVKAIHGNKSQAARAAALKEFKDKKLPILVATDVAARGLDIEKLPQVVNFELPEQAEDYVHRIGRTGRAGETGQAFSLVSAEELPKLKDIEKFTKKSLPLSEFPGLDLSQYKKDPVKETKERKGAQRKAFAKAPAKNRPHKANGGALKKKGPPKKPTKQHVEFIP